MSGDHVVIIGAGIGGLSAAVALAAKGVGVTVLEAQKHVGGKMREIAVGDTFIDAGPTVFTLRHVFDELFAEAGTSLANEVPVRPAGLLARHAWNADERLDLFVDLERSVSAVRDFAGAKEANGFRALSAHAAKLYETLDATFLRASRPNALQVLSRANYNIPALLRLSPMRSLHAALGRYLSDPRLLQLFSRYATYCGSSPWKATAALMIVSHVERMGVHYIDGGMHRLAEALARVAERLGARIRCGVAASQIEVAHGAVQAVRLQNGERIPADRVIFNGDASALASGLLGKATRPAARAVPVAERSLSALVWTMKAEVTKFPLTRHTVFFSRRYKDEFTRIFERGWLPDEPTVYICAQDRGDDATAAHDAERLLVLVNAPANGDGAGFSQTELAACEERTIAQLERCGLSLKAKPRDVVLTGPSQFNRLFPGTGGALYGRASHSWKASLQRPDARTAIKGLYLAGGSVHPGPGVPMAALSGRLAARSLLSDRALTSRWRPAVTFGGMSTQ
jgi:1-hydroxycarotenoid 3,4-desaturase